MARDQRRLAAIVSADVAGYSRLMGLDDSGTLAALKTHRRELIDPKIAEYGGRIVKTTGDGLLLEFPSVVDAVRCAVDVQRGMAERNASVAAEQRLEFRVGINVGDIIIDGDDIFGDGVNVAARLQTLAEPGGICVSKVVRDQVLDKLSFAFEDLGPQEVKNIARPVEVYRVDLASGALQTPSLGRKRWQRLIRGRWRWLGAGVVAVGIAGVLLLGMPRLWRPVAVPSPPAMSVLVTPFAAPRGDAEATRFAEALTRDLVSRLGRVTGWPGRLGVVAFQSDSAADVTDPRVLAQRFNTRYVLRGNILRSGESSAVDLQLVDAATREQVWSKRLPVQDVDILDQSSTKLRSLVVELYSAVIAAEMRRVAVRPLPDLTAPELVLRAIASFRKDPSVAGVAEARKLLEMALQLDPNWAPALLTRYVITGSVKGLDPKADRSRILREADEDTRRAVNLDPTDSEAWSWRAGALLGLERWDAALEANATAIRLDPDNADYLTDRAFIMNAIGRPAEALPFIDRALAMDTTEREVTYAAGVACMSYLLLGQAERAVAMCEKINLGSHDWGLQIVLVAAYADHGDVQKAAAAKAELLRLLPAFTVAQARASDQPSHSEYAKLAEKYLYEGLRKAGIPEK